MKMLVYRNRNISDDGFEMVVDGTLAPCSNTGTSSGGGDQDGQAGSPVAKDAVSYVLSYNANDYKSIGDGSSPSTQLVQGLGGGYKPLYNGNIAAMGVNIGKLNQPMVYNYGYDVLNRMVAMDAFTCAAGWQTLQATVNNAYAERVSYDPNGNIKSYQRNGTSTLAAMDDLTYQYPRDAAGNAINNRLRYIQDNVNDANYPNDLDNQTSLSTAQVLAEKSAETSTDYYQYDPIGNLIQEGDNTTGNTISWNVYGKIQQVHKNSNNTNIIYSYDASGNRVSKTTNTTTTYYVRDATGNVMAVYEGTSTQMKVIETDLYGSDRLGLVSTQTVATTEQTVSGFGTVRTFTFTRGEKSYELNNHLGNVLSTISDRRQQMPNNSIVSYYMAEVTSATDYYPFGMQMSSRTVSSSSYRYGFNGQEKSSELTEGQYTAQFWEYDSRTGRRWNVDPVLKEGESPYSTFSNNPILRSDPNGDKDSTGPNIVLRTVTKIPRFTANFGSSTGFFYPLNSDKATSIFAVYGGETYYNSLVYDETREKSKFKLDEPNSFIQLQYRLRDSKTQIGINWFKQKFKKDENGFDFEAPTAAQFSLGTSRNLTNPGNKVNITGNLSFGVGVEFGKPRSSDPSVSFENGKKYSIIGVGASAIYRVNATFARYITFFVAGTFHHLQTFDQNPSSGSFEGKAIGSIEFSSGLGINVGTKNPH